MEKIVILDISSLIYRFYYALPLFTSHNNIPTNALFGLTNALLKIINEENPDYIIACLDSKTKTFRHKKDINYKAQRPKIPNDLKVQLNLVPKILKAFNIEIIQKENYEADDLIGFFVKKLNYKLKVIYSGDLDLLQILDENTILKFFKRGISEVEVYDKNKVREKFHLQPYQLADLKGLIGDSSDNILGIKGIGQKTAIDLLLRFNNIEQIIYAAEKKILPEKLRNLIIDNKERLILNKELATIVTDIDLNFKIKKYEYFNLDNVYNVLKEFDFYSIIKRLKINQLNEANDFSEIKFEEKLPLFFDDLFCFIDNEVIYISDGEKYYYFNLNLEIFKKILNSKQIIVYDLKLFLKHCYKFQLEVDNIDKFFDIKIAFWLVKNIIKPDITKILYFYSKDITDNINKNNIFLKIMPKIYDDLNMQIINNQLQNVLIIDQKVSSILAIMENYGLNIDKEKLSQIRLNILEDLKNIKMEIYNLAKTEFNINSSNELRKIIFEKLKLTKKNIKKTPKGEISVKESELQKLIDFHPLIKKILDYKNKSKLLNNFIKNFLKHINDNKIYTNFEITGTNTGRITSLYPNLQNIPLELRKVFIPSQKNYIFLSYDYSQIELRILAHFSEDENLLNIFYQNLDIHTIIAKLLFKEENEKTRRLAKIINYGIIYGITPSGIAQKTGLSINTSKELINNYFRNFPGVKKFLDELINRFNSFGHTETLLGRKRFFFESNSIKATRIAINSPIQGTAADILKLALIDAFKYLKEKNILNEVRFKLIVHDEIIFEIRNDFVAKVKLRLKNIFENIVNLKVPLCVKIREGNNLKEIK
ncbi:MAG: DNA polymerase [Candidatus Parcubacteria bacterium]|nr:MAG: DNA polymerase [Candidatus Parcubacteria bacterium]